MTLNSPRRLAREQATARARSRAPHPVHKWIVVSAAVAAFALAAIAAVAPPAPPSVAARIRAYNAYHAQTFTVADGVASTTVGRDAYSATPGYETLALNGTNADWAKLVLLDGKFPMTTGNIAVIMQWMRQENGPPNWFNRNNPLNNGLGSGGAAGTGSYPNLMVAAQKAAENINRPMFAGIANAFNKAGSEASIQHAIWASAWSTSHYANGAHWSNTPVPVVRAPGGSW